jgi:sortase A
MAGKSHVPELSEAELRRMLLEKRRADRARRLQAFRRNGELLAADAKRAEAAESDSLSGPRVHHAPSLKLSAARAASWTDRALLAIELLAAAGLVYIFFNGLSVLDALNAELSSAFALAPVTSPVPVLGPVILPSGHTPPQDGQAARPNEAEIPEHLRPQMQAYTAAITMPTPGVEQALGIKIEALGVNAPIVQGDDWEALKRGVGQHIGTANPGQLGNVVLSGHNDIYGEVFRDLDQLQPGDEVTVYTAHSSYTYVNTDTQIVAPTFVEVMEPTPNATLTLISCYPYRIDSQRIVVFGELKN